MKTKTKSITEIYLENLDSDKVARKLVYLVNEASRQEKPEVEIGRALVSSNIRRRLDRARVEAQMMKAVKYNN
jgi:hypothetical protein